MKDLVLTLHFPFNERSLSQWSSHRERDFVRLTPPGFPHLWIRRCLTHKHQNVRSNIYTSLFTGVFITNVSLCLIRLSDFSSNALRWMSAPQSRVTPALRIVEVDHHYQPDQVTMKRYKGPLQALASTQHPIYKMMRPVIRSFAALPT